MELYAFGKTLNKGSRTLDKEVTDQPIKTFAKNSRNPKYDLEFLKYKYSQQTMKNPVVLDVLTSGVLKPADNLSGKLNTLVTNNTIYGKGWTAKIQKGNVYLNGQRYSDNDFLQLIKKATLYPHLPTNQLAKAIVDRTPIGVQFLKLIAENNQQLFKQIIDISYPNVSPDVLGTDKKVIHIKGGKTEQVEDLMNAKDIAQNILEEKIDKKPDDDDDDGKPTYIDDEGRVMVNLT